MEVQNLASIKNIVVGVDFSKYSRIVLKQALGLANEVGAALHIVYVHEEIYLTPASLYLVYQYTPPAPEKMKEMVKKFYRVKETDNISVVIRHGAVAKNILQFTKPLNNPLIVVGSVGHSAVTRFLLGSQAEKLALTSPYPVWVHRGSQYKSFKDILLPIDLSEPNEKLIQAFNKLSEKSKFKLNCLYVQNQTYPFLDYDTYVSFQREVKIKIRKFISEFENRNSNLKLKVKAGDAAKEIVNMGKKYDVIIMRPHNHGRLLKNFGRVTAKVIRLAHTPVLILKLR